MPAFFRASLIFSRSPGAAADVASTVFLALFAVPPHPLNGIITEHARPRAHRFRFTGFLRSAITIDELWKTAGGRPERRVVRLVVCQGASSLERAASRVVPVGLRAEGPKKTPI